MKSPFRILVLGALAGAASFLIVSRTRLVPSHPPAQVPTGSVEAATAPSHGEASQDSELAWLASEFALDAPTFQRVRELHTRYRPQCEELCRRINDHNRRLRTALLESQDLNPEAARLIAEGARLRVECQTALARHLFEVAHCLPNEQGRRYLDLMLPATGILAPSHPISETSHGKPEE